MKCALCDDEAELGRKLCLVHLIARRKYAADHRAKRAAEGRCSVCGGSPLVTTRYCAICRVLYQKPSEAGPCTVCHVGDHSRKDHRILGICWYCPKKVVGTSNLCPDHHEERHERERKAAQDLRGRWRKEGRCLICGRKAINLSRCKKHRKYAAEWERTKRVRLV